MAKKPPKITPMLRQYLDIKETYPDHLLMFRMGDFYEMFFEDAERASKLLNIALTSRAHGENSSKVPLCGVPHHALPNYLNRLVSQGVRVAICDQLEDPKKAKGLVKRGVTKLVSPGLNAEPDSLDDRKPNYFVAIYCDNARFGLAVSELSTGEFRVSDFETFEGLVFELSRVEPAELVLPQAMEGAPQCKEIQRAVDDKLITYLPDDVFEINASVIAVEKQFPAFDAESAMRDGHEGAVRAAGGALDYLIATQMRDLAHIQEIQLTTIHSNMVIDETTKRNLELLASMRDNTRRGSLLWLLDLTQTAMGARLLRKWICYPLIEPGPIRDRHVAVAEFFEAFNLREEVRGRLSKIQDLERLAGRVGLASCNARDLVSLRVSLEMLPGLKELLAQCEAPMTKQLLESLDDLADLRDLITRSIHPEPPITIRDGGLIADGFNETLDELRKIAYQGKGYLAELEAREREATGIQKLKVRYNKVFGYFLEVSKGQLDLVPEHYIRKQTLVNAERFITPELKEFEEKVLTAEEKIVALEYDLFSEIRLQVSGQIGRIQKSAQVLAQIDVLAAFAEVAQSNNYVRPQIVDEQKIEIIDGRHPVVEAAYKSEAFVPNDTHMSVGAEQLLIITGPNMAGKSTYIRQVALIQLMAQIGSFVPATSAKLTVVDRIFTRVGASDNLAKGLSTFMVEMVETGNILADATDRSLVMLDEIGRGTSTFDGLAIAWAVAEYLHDRRGHTPMTLFATHYHELTDLSRTKKRVKNYNIAVREWNDEIIFLRKIVPGGTSHSYGIQVARLAGLPKDVISRAKEILYNLERKELDEVGKPTWAKTPGSNAPSAGQLHLFSSLPSPIESEIRALDIDGLAPMDALNFLARLKKKLS